MPKKTSTGRNKTPKRKVLPSKKLGGVLGGRKMGLIKNSIRNKLK